MKNLLLSEYLLILFLVVLFLVTGCAKYLDAVPDKSLTVPNSVADYQALLENEAMFTNMPAIGEFGTDDMYYPDVLWASQQVFVRDAYLWKKDANEGGFSPSWNYSYAKIYNANVVLNGINKLRTKSTSVDINVLKGWALFCRANAFYDLQEIFGQPYRTASANTDLGIPLKLNADLQEKVARASVAETFQQIIADLSQALQLLPDQVSTVNRSKPGKAAAYALLSRVYLVMQDYEKAKNNAESCLNLYNVLIDYNTLAASARIPFSPLINEVIYNAVQINYADRNWRVDKDLYDSFAANDLRKGLFFTPDPVVQTGIFKGFYTGDAIAFDGLATDEIYLTRAECRARAGDSAGALDDLNTLLLKRYKTGTYIPYSIDAGINILSLVLAERRKECIFRNLRWSDLRRLNQDPRFARTLTRTINGTLYQLPPNDPRYVLPIPDDQIRLSGITQNSR